MQNVYDLALFALADLIVRASERGATCHPEKQQDHEPDAKEDVEHRSLLGAGRIQQRQHNQDDAGYIQEDAKSERQSVHISVLALVAPLLIHGALQAGVSDGDEKEQDTSASHQGTDDAQQVEEEVGHGLGLGLRLGAQALQLAVACLREHNQLLPECESRFGGCTLQKVADGCLAASADRGDLHLAKTALLNA